MKTLNLLAKEIAKREGKKKQVDIAQIKEILGVLCDILFEHELSVIIYMQMVEQGVNRAKRKKK